MEPEGKCWFFHLPAGWLWADFSFSQHCFFFFLIFKIFIYLFLAALGLRFYARAFSSCGKQGLLFVVVHGLLTVVASLVVEHGL